MCGDYFGFPKRNCSDMPYELSSFPCPVTNVIQICDACHQYITNIAIQYYAALGVTSANKFNQVVYFDANSTVFTSFAQVFNLLDPLVKSLSCNVFLSTTNFIYFNELTAAYPNAFFVLSLDTALRSTVVPWNYFYISGRMDLLTYVAGATTIGQSRTKIGLWVSDESIGESALRRGLFMGMASSIHRYGGVSAVPYFIRTQNEASYFAPTSNFTPAVADVFLSLSAGAIYPYMKAGYSMGLITDFLTDTHTFAHANSSESQHLLGSVTADLLGPFRALFSATARGFFQSGVFTGDRSSIFLVPCTYSCAALTQAANSSQRSSFSEILNLQFDLNIDYNFFERALPHQSVPDFVALSQSMTGVDVALMDPQVQFLSQSTIVILNLRSREAPVLLFSMELLHVQPSFINSSCIAQAELVGRVGYASAADPLSRQVFVSMGEYSNGTCTPPGNVWYSTVPWTFQVLSTWAPVKTSQGQPPAARSGHSLVFFSGGLFVFGGVLCGGGYDRSIYWLNLSLMEWSKVTPSAPPEQVFPFAAQRTVGLVVNQPTPWSLQGTSVVSSSWLMYVGGSGATFDVAAFGVPSGLFGNGVGQAANEWVFLNAGGSKVPILTNVTVLCAAMISTPTRMILVAGAQGEGFLFSLNWMSVETFQWTSPTSTASCTASVNSQLLAVSLSSVLMFRSGFTRSNKSALYFDASVKPACLDSENKGRSLSQLQCLPCGSGFSAIGEVCTLVITADNLLQIIAGCVVAALVAISAMMGARAYLTQKRLRRLLDGDRIAEKLATCVAKMDVKDLGFLHAAAEEPTRLQRAFLDILDVLTVYLLFLPSWVRDGDRLVPPQPSTTNPGPRRRQSVSLADSSSDTATVKTTHRSSSTSDQFVLRYLQALPSGRLFRSQLVFLHIHVPYISNTSAGDDGRLDDFVDVRKLSQLLGTISQLCQQHCGLVEWAACDNVLVSFNGLRSNMRGLQSAAIVAHRLCVVMIGDEHKDVAINDAFSAPAGTTTLSLSPIKESRQVHFGTYCGIASGVATVGVVGRVNGLQSFIDGAVVSDAKTLSRYGRLLNAKVAMRQCDASSIKNAVTSVCLGRIKLALDRDTELLSSVVGLVGEIPLPERFSHEARNEVFEALHLGKVTAAKAVLANLNVSLTEKDSAVVRQAMETSLIPLHVLSPSTAATSEVGGEKFKGV